MNKERFLKFPLKTQLGHVAAEVARARLCAEKRDEKAMGQAVIRSLEMIDCAMSGKLSQGRLKELEHFHAALTSFHGGHEAAVVRLSDIEGRLMKIVMSDGKD